MEKSRRPRAIAMGPAIGPCAGSSRQMQAILQTTMSRLDRQLPVRAPEQTQISQGAGDIWRNEHQWKPEAPRDGGRKATEGEHWQKLGAARNLPRHGRFGGRGILGL